MQKQQKKKKNAERKKKKKEKKKKWRCSSSKTRPWRPRLQRDLDRRATQVAERPRLLRDHGQHATPVSVFGFFFSFFFFLLWWTYIFCCCGFLLLLSLRFCLFFILVANQVLETWFSCRCHVEKVSHQTWTIYKNWVSKTWFINTKSSFLDSKC